MSKEIGMRLRRAREAMGFTLIDVAKKTNIELKYLIAIEKGEWNRLPNIIYARAYVKNYATLVGESVRMTQASRRASVADSEPMYPPRASASRTQNKTNLIHTKKRRIPRQIEAEVLDSDANDFSNTENEGQRRVVTMPSDMPDPEELGIVDEVEEDEEDEQVDTADTGEISLSRRRSSQQEASESRFGIWYTRFLIVGCVLLLFGFGIFLYLKFTSPPGIPLS